MIVRKPLRAAPKRKVRLRLSQRRLEQLARLRDRESSLVTLCTESPKQLAKIRKQIAVIERRIL